MPSWADIRPSAIANQLPFVWCYFYDAEQDDFIGRLGGEAIARVFGRPIKGAKLSELFPIVGREQMAARLKRVMTEPALVSGFGRLFQQDDHHGVGERIIMPLALMAPLRTPCLESRSTRCEAISPLRLIRWMQKRIGFRSTFRAQRLRCLALR
jgi:hypothetical protein